MAARWGRRSTICYTCLPSGSHVGRYGLQVGRMVGVGSGGKEGITRARTQPKPRIQKVSVVQQRLQVSLLYPNQCCPLQIVQWQYMFTISKKV